MSLHLEAIRRNALGHQEVFRNLSTPFRQPLVVPAFPALVGVADECQAGIGLVLEIFLESVGPGGKSRLLAQHETFAGFNRSRYICWEVNAVKRQTIVCFN